MHDVAGIDQADTHAAVARRDDGGVIELRLRGFDGGTIGVDRRNQLIDLGLLLVDDLLGLEALVDQGAGPLEVLLRRDELGVVLRLSGLGLVERRLIEPRIDLGQHIALADVLALLEQDLLELAVDLRTDADGERGLHRAEPGQVDRQILL